MGHSSSMLQQNQAHHLKHNTLAVPFLQSGVSLQVNSTDFRLIIHLIHVCFVLFLFPFHPVLSQRESAYEWWYGKDKSTVM